MDALLFDGLLRGRDGSGKEVLFRFGFLESFGEVSVSHLWVWVFVSRLGSWEGTSNIKLLQTGYLLSSTA